MKLIDELQKGIKPVISQTHLPYLWSNFQQTNTYHRVKTLGFLLLFLLAFPITLVITSTTLIIHLATRKPQIVNPNAKRILISGGGMTKALQLARSFYAAGHYIVLTEEYSYTAHRFSRCVSRFCLCTDTQNNHPVYMQSMIDIVKRERIDVFVPATHSWNEVTDAVLKQKLLTLNCETIHGDVEQLQMLSNKYAFVERARSLGLDVPKSYKITDRNQILEFDFSREKCQFLMKCIADDTVTRWNITKLPCPTLQQTIDFVNSLTISKDNPWIMQEFIPGKEYCTHGTIRNGELTLHTCCPSSSWLLRYKHDDNKPLILQWVRDFCSRANITGQASFDFIESNENGRPYAIECNPRTHTAITAFYNHPLVAEAFLNPKPLPNSLVQPYSNARETYWVHHELWNLFTVRSTGDLVRQFQLLFNGKEAINSVDDPLPFFLHYTIHMPIVLICNLLSPRRYTKVDCNLGLIL